MQLSSFVALGVSGSMIKTNSNGDKESPWKMALALDLFLQMSILSSSSSCYC